MNEAMTKYLRSWNLKTGKAVKKELASMRKYVQKHSASYAWNNAGTAPGSIADGDKILILEEILRTKLQPPAGSP